VTSVERKVAMGFTDSRQGVLDALYRMGAACCAYSNGLVWADRCDCKYGVVRSWPAAGEKGNGCPELRSLYGVVDAMPDEEWGRLVQLAGGVLRGAARTAVAPSGEELRLVRRLLESAHPRIDQVGTIAFFGFEDLDRDDGVRRLMEGYRSLCERAGFTPPPPTTARTRPRGVS
jgi:hypothetical protein